MQEKNNDISLYLGLFEKSPTVLRKAIVTTPYSGFKLELRIEQGEVLGLLYLELENYLPISI